MKSMVNKAVRATADYLLSFTQTQLAITLISLPIVVGWGLGYSAMSLVGNLIFGPVLTLFLVISSLLLFTQLLGIPNSFLATLLNWLTHIWNWIINQGSPSWLIECAKPNTLILIAIPIAVYWVLQHKKITTPARRLGALCGLLIAMYGLFEVQRRYNQAHSPLTYRLNDKLYAIRLANQSALIVIDEGFFGRKKSIEKAINYEVKPLLIKQFGSVRIKEWRILKPSAGSLRAAQYLCTIWPVEAVWLTLFKKPLSSKYGWRTFFDLKRFLSEKKIRFVRFYNAPRTSRNEASSKTH